MSRQARGNGPSHMAPGGRGKSGGSTGRSSQKKNTQQRRSSGRNRENAPIRREPLNDNYYYEQPPQSRSRYSNFEDISSYSSDKKRKDDRRTRNKGKQKGSKKKFLIPVLLLLIIVGGGLYYIFGYMLGGLTINGISRDKLSVNSGALTDTGIKNIALFGLDARENENEGRSDAVMILTVDNKHGKLKLTSILRDSEVQIDGYGGDKLTHAYAYGGPELAIKTLNQNFNLDIEDYVTVNFIEMAQIVDAFGGTRVNISYDEMNEINTNLALLESESYDANVVSSDYMYEDGNVLLNGNQAVAYARIRHLEGGDDVRAGRQQTVLMGLIEQLKGKSKLEYPELIHQITPLCETSLDFGDIIGMSPIMLTDFQMETLSIPGEEENAYGDTNEDGRWVYLYDTELASQHISRFIYEEDSPYYTGGNDTVLD